MKITQHLHRLLFKKNNKKYSGRLVSVFGLLSALSFFVILLSVLGFLDRVYWVFELITHFRLQLFISLFTVSLISLILRNYRLFFPNFILAIINLCFIIPLFLPISNESNGKNSKRCLLVNVNTDNSNYGYVRNLIKKYNPDLFVVEEINDKWEMELKCLTEQYKYKITKTRVDNFGIGLYSKIEIDSFNILYLGLVEVPSIFCVLKDSLFEFSVLATHPLPPTSSVYVEWRNDHLFDVSQFSEKHRNHFLVIGDLNVTPFSYQFRKLMKLGILKNSQKGFGYQASWPSNSIIFSIPIDHILHTTDIKIINRFVGEKIGSDHLPVILDFIVE